MTTERRLGFLEKFQLSRRLGDLYSCYQITAKFNKPISKELLSNALKILIEKYNVLRLTVKKEQDGNTKDYNNFLATPATSLLFDDVVEIRDKSFTVEEVEYFNNQLIQIGENIVTWRVALYPDGHLTYYTNHLFTDGQSGAHFFEEIAKIFDLLADKQLEFIPELVADTPFTLPKEITELVDIFDLSSMKEKTTIGGLIIKGALKKLNPFGSEIYKSTHIATYKSLFKVIEVDNKKIKTILSIIRQHQVTITAFLDIVLRYTTQKVILSKLVSKPMAVTSGIVTSGRRFFPELEKELKFQNIVSESKITLPPVLSMDRKSVLMALKKINKILSKDLESKAQFSKFGILKKLGVDVLVEPEKKNRTSDTLFEISNLGLRTIEEGSWQVERFVFTQPTSISAPFDVSIISSPQYLTIGLSYIEEYLKFDFDQFEKVFQEAIEFFINDDSQ